MKTNKLTQAAQSISVRDGAIVTTPDLIKALSAAKSLQAEIDEFYSAIKTAMKDNNVTKWDGDWGLIQFRPTPYYSIDGKVAPRFTRQAVDGDEVKHYMKHHDGKLPKGIAVKNVNKFYKRIK
jgi:hypothetical protein